MFGDTGFRIEALPKQLEEEREKKEKETMTREDGRNCSKSGTGPAVGSLEKRQISLVYINTFF